MWGTPDGQRWADPPRESCRVLIVGNTKGGVGKTVFSFNLADCLARTGLRVLVVDLDLQCGQLAFLHQPPPDPEHDAGAVIGGRCDIDDAVPAVIARRAPSRSALCETMRAMAAMNWK